MPLNIFTIIAIVIIQYVIGALWYSVLFGKQWIDINHPDGHPSKEEMEEMEKEAIPYYGIQLVLTIVTVLAQWYFVMMQNTNWFIISMVIWGGYLVPTAVQTVIWSDLKNKKKALQIFILSLNYLVTILLAGWALATFR
jgi:heme O synthase-like polyprenyltransferase